MHARNQLRMARNHSQICPLVLPGYGKLTAKWPPQTFSVCTGSRYTKQLSVHKDLRSCHFSSKTTISRGKPSCFILEVGIIIPHCLHTRDSSNFFSIKSNFLKKITKLIHVLKQVSTQEKKKKKCFKIPSPGNDPY